MNAFLWTIAALRLLEVSSEDCGSQLAELEQDQIAFLQVGARLAPGDAGKHTPVETEAGRKHPREMLEHPGDAAEAGRKHPREMLEQPVVFTGFGAHAEQPEGYAAVYKNPVPIDPMPVFRNQVMEKIVPPGMQKMTNDNDKTNWDWKEGDPIKPNSPQYAESKAKFPTSPIWNNKVQPGAPDPLQLPPMAFPAAINAMIPTNKEILAPLKPLFKVEPSPQEPTAAEQAAAAKPLPEETQPAYLKNKAMHDYLQKKSPGIAPDTIPDIFEMQGRLAALPKPDPGCEGRHDCKKPDQGALMAAATAAEKLIGDIKHNSPAVTVVAQALTGDNLMPDAVVKGAIDGTMSPRQQEAEIAAALDVQQGRMHPLQAQDPSQIVPMLARGPPPSFQQDKTNKAALKAIDKIRLQGALALTVRRPAPLPLAGVCQSPRADFQGALVNGQGDGYDWRCLDGRCILYGGRCDGKAQCLDGSDELYCNRQLFNRVSKLEVKHTDLQDELLGLRGGATQRMAEFNDVKALIHSLNETLRQGFSNLKGRTGPYLMVNSDLENVQKKHDELVKQFEGFFIHDLERNMDVKTLKAQNAGYVAALADLNKQNDALTKDVNGLKEDYVTLKIQADTR